MEKIYQENFEKQKEKENEQNKEFSRSFSVEINEIKNSPNELNDLRKIKEEEDIIKKYKKREHLSFYFKDAEQKYKRLMSSQTMKTTLFVNNAEGDTRKSECDKFIDLIEAQIYEVKNRTLSYLNETIKNLDLKYNLFIENIKKFLNENDEFFEKVSPQYEKNDNITEYAYNSIFEKIADLIEINDSIVSAIKSHFDLLGNYLSKNELIEKKNPIEYFVNFYYNEIVQSWIIKKIDFNKINFSNVSFDKDFYDLCINYLYKQKDISFSSAVFTKGQTEALQKQNSNIIKENASKLEKLKFIELDEKEIKLLLYHQNNQNLKTENLRKLRLINCDFTTITKIPNLSLSQLVKFTIKGSMFPSNNIFLSSILGEMNKLTSLKLEKLNLIDQDLVNIFKIIYENKIIFNTLEVLSLANNRITKVQLITKEIGEFNELKELNFSNNNIFKFSPVSLVRISPKLKVLDVSYNNFCNKEFLDAVCSTKIIVLFAGNWFIMNNTENNSKYLNYLFSHLHTFKYRLKKLHLSFIENRNNFEQLLSFEMSPVIKISLIKLELSYSGLNSENVKNFLENNYGLINLKVLVLKYNFIDNEIFTYLLSSKILLEKLKTLDLGYNSIRYYGLKNFTEIENFIYKHSKFQKLKLQGNKFFIELNNLKDYDKNETKNMINKFSQKKIKIVVDAKLKKLTDNDLSLIFEFKDK